MAPLLLLRRSSATVFMQHCHHYNYNHTVQHVTRTVAALSTSAGSSWFLSFFSFLFFLFSFPFFFFISSSFSLAASTSTQPPPRINEVGIQMLSESLRQQIFGPIEPSAGSVQKEEVRNELLKFGLKPDSVELEEQISFKLPPILGGNVQEHFRQIATKLGAPYLQQGQFFALLSFSLQKPCFSFFCLSSLALQPLGHWTLFSY